MKQKILSVLLFSAMILSMAGCGGTQSADPNENGSETSQEDEVVTSTVSETTTAEQEQTENETTTTEPVEEEPPKEILKISDYESFENGTFHFKINKTGYVYDILENKMYSYNPYELENNDTACGKLIADDKTITNLETMENYDVKPFDYTGLCLDKYNPVYSVKEDFDGNVYSFGILGSNGEWVLPMSSDYAICDLLKSRTIETWSELIATSSFVSFEANHSYYYYNYKTNEIKEFESHNSERCFHFMDNFILYKENRNNDFSLYNTKTGNTTVLDSMSDLYCSENCTVLSNITHYSSESYIFTIIDSNGNILDYDLSDYNTTPANICDATEDYIVFIAENADNAYYVVILDKDGNRVIDPIKISDYYISNSNLHIYGDYIVYAYYYDKSFIVNCKAGETKIYTNHRKPEDSIMLIDFDSYSGKLLIKSDGNYYLADVSDPDTLINPFEVAEIQ